MRKHYIDNIRWVTVMIVLLYHVFYMYNGVGVLGGLSSITGLKVQYYDIFLYIVYPWMMVLLFIVSGVSARYSLDYHTTKEFMKAKTTRFLVPSTIGLFVFWFIQGYISMSLGGAFETMQIPAFVAYIIMAVSGIGVMWYIQLLWLFSLVLVLIRKVEKDRLWKLGAGTSLPILIFLVVPLWGAAQMLNAPVIVTYRIGIYLFAYLLGYYVFSHGEVIAVLKKWLAPLFIITAGLGAAFCVTYFGQNYADAPVNRTPLFVAYGYFASLTMFGAMAKFGDKSTAFTEWMRKKSYGLYLFHYLGISAVALFVGKTGNLPAVFVYLLSLIAGIACGLLLYPLISRIPFFRWAVLGIKR